jgi:plastocyanin
MRLALVIAPNRHPTKESNMKRTLSSSAIATAICLLGVTLSVQAQPAGHSMHNAAASSGTATAAAQPAATKRYDLHTNIVDGKMVFVDDKGQVNPTLSANAGDTIEIVLESGEGAEHDLVIPELNVASAKFSAGTGKTTLRFKVPRSGAFTYYCSIPGHRQIGMEGKTPGERDCGCRRGDRARREHRFEPGGTRALHPRPYAAARGGPVCRQRGGQPSRGAGGHRYAGTEDAEVPHGDGRVARQAR